MITFKSLTMQNFLSYGAIPTTIQLDRPGTTLLLGQDLDNTASGTGANGVGKTVIINALVYGIYDQPISNISKDNLINNINKKNMVVSVTFEKEGKTYTVIRSRKVKVGAAGNFTTLLQDGKDITPAGADNTNEEIVKIIGIPYEIFVRVVAVSAIHTPFLDLPTRSGSAANQTDIIEQLFDLKTLSEKADILKLHIKDTEASIKTHNERAIHIDKEYERHSKQLDAAKKRVIDWQLLHDNDIKEAQHSIQKLENVDVSAQRKIYDTLQKNKELYEQERNACVELNKDLTTKKQQLLTRETEIAHLQKGECPRCHQKFKDKNLGTLIEEHKILEQQIIALQHDVTCSKANTDNTSANIKDLTKLLQFKTLEELLTCKNRIDQLKEKLIELQNTENPYIEVLEELESIQLDKKDMTAINTLKNTLDHQNFLLKVLTKKDSFVRKALLNRNIPFLNNRLQKYLSDLGLPHTVEFTHEMTASITQFGHAMDFGNLSNGQRARVNLALSFAFRDVLQSMHDHVNICLLDEVLDVGLDTVGVQAAAKMLKRKARDEKLALYIISHRDEIDSAFDRKMVVQMSGGFSSLRYEDE